MTDSGNGNYTLPAGYLAVPGQTILSSQHNPPLEDIAASLNRRSFRDGRAPMVGNQPYNGFRVTGAGDAVGAQDYVTLAQMQAMIAAAGLVPTGTIVMSAGTQDRAGYARLDGRSLLRTAEPALYAFALASGNMAATQGAKTKGQFGPGDGSTTFTIPDLGDEFTRGLPSSGRGIGSIQADTFKSHQHTGTTDARGNHSHGGVLRFAQTAQNPGGNASAYGTQGNTDDAGNHDHPFTTDSTGDTETRPRNIAYPYMIKT